MGNQVELSVRSRLKEIITELEAISAKAKTVGDDMKAAGENVGDSLNNQTKKTETFLTKLRGLSGRVADQIRGDFKSLAGLNAIRESLRLSDQFRGTITETFRLSDSIRKLSTFFGIAGDKFGSFQNRMIKGLGDAGLSSEVGAKAMEGIAASGAPVKSDQLMSYAVSSGRLARATGDKGSEGNIAGLLGSVIQARGGDVNDPKQFQALAEDVLKVFNATGAKASETLSSMNSLFKVMDSDLRKKISSKGLANLAAAGSAAGPEATTFIQDYLKKSLHQRAGMDARGMGDVFGENGINTDQVSKLYSESKRLGGGDARLGVKAATGIENDDVAEGFIRLAENLERVKRATDSVNQSTAKLADQDRATMGFSESFSASVNKVKGWFADLSEATQAGTEVLSKASQSNTGAGAVVAGGGLVSSLLAGFGLKTAGAAIASKGVAGAAASAGGAGLGMAGAGGAGLLGYGASKAFEAIAQPGGIGEITEGVGLTKLGESLKSLEKTISEWGARITGAHSKPQKHIVELNDRQLKTSVQPSRGATH